MAQFVRRPMSEPRRFGQLGEYPGNVARVQHRADGRREHQPVIVPAARGGPFLQLCGAM